MGRRYLEIRGVKVDGRGRRYADVTSDEAEAAGMSVLVPLVLVKGEPKSATSSVASATSSVSAPTASDLRDLLSEADAILLDSSATESSRMNAGSSSSVRGSKSSRFARSENVARKRGSNGSGPTPAAPEKMSAILFALSAIVLSFTVGLVVGGF